MLFLRNIIRLIFCLVTVSAIAQTDLPRQSKLDKRGLPEPPQQHLAWAVPSSGLPSNFVSSAQVLFDCGLADPRGCDYHEVEVSTGSVWGGGQVVKIHGWVMPAQAGWEQQFVIAWNGLVYPALKVGERTDMKGDIELLIRSEEVFLKKDTNKFGVQLWSNTSPPSYLISETNFTAIKPLLLLRLGEQQLAERCWNLWQTPGKANSSKEDQADPFRMLAYYWSWALFDRAICAHMQSDDALALADGRSLSALWPKLEKEAARRGFPQPLSVDNQVQPYFGFLETVNGLLIDQERRAKEGTTGEPLPTKNLTNQVTRIANLIANLDETKARQWGQPGGVWFGDDPGIKALIAEGEAAVEPLLECLANDQRLTRSVSFHRDFFPQRNILPVKAAARTALAGILKVDLEGAAEYRAYWKKYKTVPMTDRWLKTLQDEKAGANQWLAAADNLLSRTDGKQVFLWGNAPIPNATNRFAYYATNLYEHARASVSEALLKRAIELAPTGYKSTLDCWAYNNAVRLGLMLAEWDPVAAKTGLKEIHQRTRIFLSQLKHEGTTGTFNQFALLAVALAELGDDEGLVFYSDWLSTKNYSDLTDSLPKILSPLGRFPEHPKIKEAAAALFQKEKSKWIGNSRWPNDLLRSRLLYNEAFRSLVLNAFDDKTAAGQITVKEKGRFTIETPGSTENLNLKADADTPAVGAKIAFRRCDEIAYRLAHIEDLPEFQLYWPENKRDAALVDVRKFLQEHGRDFKLKPGMLFMGDF